MGQYTSTLNSNSNSQETQQTQGRNLVLENQQLRNIIQKISTATEQYLAERKLHDEKNKHALAEIQEMFKNPKPYQHTDPVEAEFERPIFKKPEIMREELHKFAEFITGNMDAILASPEIINAEDELIFAQLVNSAGIEYARVEVTKRNANE